MLVRKCVQACACPQVYCACECPVCIYVHVCGPVCMPRCVCVYVFMGAWCVHMCVYHVCTMRVCICVCAGRGRWEWQEGKRPRAHPASAR